MAKEKQVVRGNDGFVSLGSVADARWFHLANGNSMTGRLLGVYEREDPRAKSSGGKSKFFQVKLQTACKVRDGRGEDAQIVDAKVGDVVNLNYGPKTQVLEAKCDELLQGAVYDIRITVGKKLPLNNGNTMWDIKVEANRLKKASADVKVTDFEGGEDEELADQLGGGEAA